MMPYIYTDEDNGPMNEEAWQHERSKGRMEEPLPFTDLPEPGWEEEHDEQKKRG